MPDPYSIVVGLEIGTSKICAAVAEAGPEGELTLIGIGQSASRGVRKAEVIDVGKTSEDVRRALANAESMADVEINSVYLGVSGGHVHGRRLRGALAIASALRPIDASDVEDAVARARQTPVEPGFEVTDSARLPFQVDQSPPCSNPVGRIGSLLFAHLHVVLARTAQIETARALLEPMHVKVVKPVFNGLAAALAILTPAQKENGALVLDWGAGALEYVFIAEGGMRHSGVLAVGGDHIANDLACGLDITLEAAQGLKRNPEVAAAIHAGRVASPPVAPAGTRPGNIEKARKIIGLRVEETLELVAEDLATNLPQARPREVVLCGGCARLAGVEAAARRQFRAPVSIGRAHNASGPEEVLANPEFATPIGLVRYAASRSRRRPGGDVVSQISRFFRR